jgi:6-phosphogluconolactonase
MGEDGHTASIFPDQMEIMRSNNICEVAVHPQSKQKRVTLTGRVINNASRISFLVTGKSKAAITSEILNNNINSEKYPAAQIKPGNGI